MSGIFKSVRIRQTQVKDNSYVTYKVEIVTKDTNWSVWRRFSDFVALDEKICGTYSVPALPPKQMFGKTSATLTEQRRKALERYLQVLLCEHDNSVVENPYVAKFLDLAGKINVHSLESRLNSWCSECEEMTQLANEISANLAERQRLSARHESDSTLIYAVRKKLQTLNAKIDELAASLVEAENAGGILTDAEILRRQNMLQTLTGRRDELGRMESSHTATVVNQRNQLLEAQSGGRVWGRETPNTVDKSNTDIVKSQRQMMQEQDDGLDRLSGIVQRQKMIAQSIGHELEEQNRMLDDLDSRVERTNMQLGSTTKRVMKLL